MGARSSNAGRKKIRCENTVIPVGKKRKIADTTYNSLMRIDPSERLVRKRKTESARLDLQPTLRI